MGYAILSILQKQIALDSDMLSWENMLYVSQGRSQDF